MAITLVYAGTEYVLSSSLYEHRGPKESMIVNIAAECSFRRQPNSEKVRLDTALEEISRGPGDKTARIFDGSNGDVQGR